MHIIIYMHERSSWTDMFSSHRPDLCRKLQQPNICHRYKWCILIGGGGRGGVLRSFMYACIHYTYIHSMIHVCMHTYISMSNRNDGPQWPGGLGRRCSSRKRRAEGVPGRGHPSVKDGGTTCSTKKAIHLSKRRQKMFLQEDGTHARTWPIESTDLI